MRHSYSKYPDTGLDKCKHVAAPGIEYRRYKIILVGRSRGGLEATVLAKMLAPLVKAYFLGLYDSVSRQPCLDGQTVENVVHVYHAMRDPEVGSRYTFGNTSTEYSKGTDYHQQKFTTSHGGIGGDYVSDPKRSSFGSDTACLVRRDYIQVRTEYGITLLDNRAPLTKKLHRPIEEICDDGSKQTDIYIRNAARQLGLPVK